MRRLGYDSVIISTLSTNGGAQQLYRRLGREHSGCFLMPDNPLETLFLKAFQ